ncbi:MAG: hypothetical protein FWH12_03770 [Treponema sp.]|nr:hypothetical protein [Treponema sp.]
MEKAITINGTEFSYTLTKKKYSTHIAYENNGVSGESLLRRGADDFDAYKLFRGILGIYTTSDFNNLGKRGRI